MSGITIESERIKQIEGEIVGLWNQCEEAIDQIRNRANIAVQIAWKVGKLLIEAKKELGHGNFRIWQDKVGIPHSTSSNYMFLAEKYPNIGDLPENKRQAYLAIGILPDKERSNLEGDTRLENKPHYLTFYNKWNGWWTDVKDGKIVFNPSEEVKTELKPMYEWMKGIYGEN